MEFGGIGAFGQVEKGRKNLDPGADLVARRAETFAPDLGRSAFAGVSDRPVQPPDPPGQDRANLVGAQRYHQIEGAGIKIGQRL